MGKFRVASESAWAMGIVPPAVAPSPGPTTSLTTEGPRFWRGVGKRGREVGEATAAAAPRELGFLGSRVSMFSSEKKESGGGELQRENTKKREGAVVTAPDLYNTQKVQILLTKLRAAVRTNKESENTSQWQREPKHIFLHWRRTRKCGPKKFPTEIDEKTTKTPISVGNFFGAVLLDTITRTNISGVILFNYFVA